MIFERCRCEHWESQHDKRGCLFCPCLSLDPVETYPPDAGGPQNEEERPSWPPQTDGDWRPEGLETK